MVILHYKKTDLNQFLMETHTGIPIEDLLNDVCESKWLKRYKWSPLIDGSGMRELKKLVVKF